MMQSPPPLSPLRRWAARLALLAACVASVATSEAGPPGPPSVLSEFEGALLTMRTEAPTAKRRFRVQVTATAPSSQPIDLRLFVQLSARWKPDSPTSPLKPSLRTRLVLPTGFTSADDWVGPNEFSGLDQGLPADSSGAFLEADAMGVCKLETGCEWSFPIEIELLPRGAVGAVEVGYRVDASATAEGTKELLEGFAVRITEE